MRSAIWRDLKKTCVCNCPTVVARCKLCIRVLRFDPVCDNCTYQPLNTNVVSTRRVENRAYEMRTQTSIAESTSQRRSTNIDLHNHTQLAIHLRQPPSINATPQDPPSIHNISPEENSGVAHSSTEHCQSESVCDEVPSSMKEADQFTITGGCCVKVCYTCTSRFKGSGTGLQTGYK
nr:hypothetical protein [Tanacetum cinerariifolium]